MFVMAALLTEVSSLITDAIGIGAYFSVLAAAFTLVSAVALARILRQIRAAPELSLVLKE
jgi:hypothetical protein